MKYLIILIITFLTGCVNSEVDLEIDKGKNEKEIEKIRIENETNNSEKYVIGNSMEPLIKNNSTVLFKSGYYEDIKIKEDIDKKGDIVLYDYKGDKNPIIKKIVATDKNKVEIKNNTLYVNDEEVKNSIGDSYNFNENEQKIMKLYINKDNNIPTNSVFILGDNIHNSNDSRKFGAVSMKDVLGKVELD